MKYVVKNIDNIPTQQENSNARGGEMNKTLSCSSCRHSELTLDKEYLRCKLNGNCYIPSIMKDRISNDCPLYKKDLKKMLTQ